MCKSKLHSDEGCVRKTAVKCVVLVILYNARRFAFDFI